MFDKDTFLRPKMRVDQCIEKEDSNRAVLINWAQGVGEKAKKGQRMFV